jgi:hypothetical protein
MRFRVRAGRKKLVMREKRNLMFAKQRKDLEPHAWLPGTRSGSCSPEREGAQKHSLAAAFLAALDAMLRRLGPGWSFLFFGATLFIVLLALVLL